MCLLILVRSPLTTLLAFRYSHSPFVQASVRFAIPSELFQAALATNGIQQLALLDGFKLLQLPPIERLYAASILLALAKLDLEENQVADPSWCVTMADC